jgi:hypothetical protein
MNRSVFLCCGLLAAGSVAAEGPSHREQAMGATAAFGKALKTELVAAMQAGGPLKAIEVCNTKAPGIAEMVSMEQGMNLSRVSMKNRNPHNAPNGWQIAVLADFEERVEAGEDAGSLSWQETVGTGDTREYRFMKAIPTGTVCLACHGKAISPEVQAKLAELYPGDKATGFSEGDLRGAFVVTQSIPSD